MQVISIDINTHWFNLIGTSNAEVIRCWHGEGLNKPLFPKDISCRRSLFFFLAFQPRCCTSGSLSHTRQYFVIKKKNKATSVYRLVYGMPPHNFIPSEVSIIAILHDLSQDKFEHGFSTHFAAMLQNKLHVFVVVLIMSL